MFHWKWKRQQWKYLNVVIIDTGHNKWYELLLSLIFDAYFVTNDMCVKCHYNEQLLTYFISKGCWVIRFEYRSMKRFHNEMVKLTYNNCTCPKMFVAFKSHVQIKGGGREISNFLNLQCKHYLIYGLTPPPPRQT